MRSARAVPLGRLVRAASALLMASAFTSATASGLPQLPPGTRLESVIDEGAIEGYRVSVMRFRSGLPVDELLAQLRSQSRLQPRVSSQARVRADARAGTEVVTQAGVRADASDLEVERQVGGWRVLSQRDGEGFRTIQLRAALEGGTEGLHTRWQAMTRAPGSGLDPASLLPPGARLLRRFSATDGGQRGETLVAWCLDPVDRTLEILHERLRAVGFEGGAPVTGRPGGSAHADVTRDAAGKATGASTPTSGAHPSGVARFYRKPGQEIVLTVASHPGQTGLVLHHSEVSP